VEYIRLLLCDQEDALTPEAQQLHQRGMTGYADMASRAIKPEPLITIRLAEHALVVGGPTLFAQTLCRYSEAFRTFGFYQTYAALIDRALVLVSPLSAEAADLHLQMGELRRQQEDYQAAFKHYEVALQTARKIADAERIASALSGLGQISLARGHLIEADMWLRDAVSYYDVSPNKSGLANVSLLAAEVSWLQGHTQEANKTLNAALQATSEIRNHRQQAKMMSAIYAAWGRMYERIGDIERSTEEYHKALDLTKDIYDREAEAEVRVSLSSIFERVGNLKSAEEQLSSAIIIYQDLKSLEEWAETNLRLARIAEVQGRPGIRDFYIEQARQMYQQLGNKQKLWELEGKKENE
jgi:tetratricopeptide (TPR) repeat protein